MQAIIFVGIQASGKSTFYKERFFHTHLRISLDMLNTRNKEQQILDTCLELHQKVVIDNTNPSVKDRKRYIDRLKAKKYRIIGYYFQSKLPECLQRNELRTGKQRIPEVGVVATYTRLQVPTFEEGFDELYYVAIGGEGFVVKDWELEEEKNRDKRVENRD